MQRFADIRFQDIAVLSVNKPGLRWILDSEHEVLPNGSVDSSDGSNVAGATEARVIAFLEVFVM